MNDTAIAPSTERQAFYDRIGEHSLAPLWERLHSMVTRQPVTPALPAKWDYDDVVRPFLMQAGGLITAKEAERRVLILENPGLRGQNSITHSLFAGLQLIMPGEVAPAHRHSQSALRFIIEGHGAYTAVEGERTMMEPGDFVITPSWTWHDHGNDTDQPMVWLDGLDIPIVRLFDASFAEPANADSQTVTRPAGDSLARYGANMLPVDWHPTRQEFAGVQLSLCAIARGAGDAGAQRRAGRLPRLQAALRQPGVRRIGNADDRRIHAVAAAGFASAPYRSTDGTVFVAVEGEGETVIGDTTLRWKPRDIFVVPSWHWHRHRASSEAVLFSFSDRPVQEKLALWREERRIDPRPSPPPLRGRGCGGSGLRISPPTTDPGSRRQTAAGRCG